MIGTKPGDQAKSMVVKRVDFLYDVLKFGRERGLL
jgi:hypothetical protein